MSKHNREREDFSHITVPEGAKLIPLTKGKYALVDEEDYERVNKHSWHSHTKDNNTFYASSFVNKKMTKLHRFILNISDKNIKLDHKNRNGLDNRKQNLRVSSSTDNSRNTKPHKSSTSKYKGVSYFLRDKKWKVQICVNGKSKHIGYFLNEIDAAKAYDAKAKEFFGEFAYINFK